MSFLRRLNRKSSPIWTINKKAPSVPADMAGQAGMGCVSGSSVPFTQGSMSVSGALCQYLMQASWDILLRGMDLPSRYNFYTYFYYSQFLCFCFVFPTVVVDIKINGSKCMAKKRGHGTGSLSGF